MGLQNARLESWGPFGVGWSLERVSVRMVLPSVTPLYAVPRAWSVGTNGPVRAKAVRAKIESEKDFEEYKGKLTGKAVLLSEAKEIAGEEKPALTRFDEQSLAELGRYPIPAPRKLDEERAEEVKRHKFWRALRAFLADEGAAAVLEASHWPGVIRTGGTGGFRKGAARGVPSFVLMPEQYNRLVRLVERKLDVELELDLKVAFDERDLMSYNTLAEIPGGDKKDEVVMAGAHLDSWHAGTGATDNGAGVAVVLEAARILKALGVTPRRTLRFALWTGEEETLGGSTTYVARNFAEWPAAKDEEEQELSMELQQPSGPLTLKPDYDKLSAYFNLDNGTGRVRGVYMQENAALQPIFEAWMKPLADLGVSQLTMRNTEDTDIDAFGAVGLPAFQFIQDDVEYETRTWHTNLDVYDRLKREDLMEASVVMAAFLYDAAMRDEALPRKPLETR
jgi:carboxypeptidase Q